MWAFDAYVIRLCHYLFLIIRVRGFKTLCPRCFSSRSYWIINQRINGRAGGRMGAQTVVLFIFTRHKQYRDMCVLLSGWLSLKLFPLNLKFNHVLTSSLKYFDGNSAEFRRVVDFLHFFEDSSAPLTTITLQTASKWIMHWWWVYQQKKKLLHVYWTVHPVCGWKNLGR